MDIYLVMASIKNIYFSTLYDWRAKVSLQANISNCVTSTPFYIMRHYKLYRTALLHFLLFIHSRKLPTLRCTRMEKEFESWKRAKRTVFTQLFKLTDVSPAMGLLGWRKPSWNSRRRFSPPKYLLMVTTNLGLARWLGWGKYQRQLLWCKAIMQNWLC